MSVSDELLDKYFKGRCTPEEKLLVVNFLNEVNDLSEYLNKDEWDQTHDANIDDVKTEEIFNAVKKQTAVKVYKWKWLGIGAAAAIFLALLTVAFLGLKQKEINTNLAVHNIRNKEKLNVINWKSVMNYTDHNQLFTLPDSSTINIYPGAELRFALPFVKDKREVYLKGKSFFQVTKDKKHPFVVYSNGIATTALGTSFTITSIEKSRFIKVELHTGKVWIKNIDSVHRVAPFSKILLPGKELVYNCKINKVTVTDSRSVWSKHENRPGELSFTQVPLVDVFAKLERHYKVKIAYNLADLQEMSFTGNLKLTQPISTILEEITELNKLNQIKTTEGYLIRK